MFSITTLCPTRAALAALVAIATFSSATGVPSGASTAPAAPPPPSLSTATSPALAAVPPDPPRYHPPVDAPVIDPFRPPPVRWAAGNRGLLYATMPGTRVLAVSAGVVTFAGAVAGTLWVTVRHPDGIRTSTSLATILVARGQVVTGSTVIGLAAARLHLGARRGDTYIDPASLWGRRSGPAHVILVPLDGNGSPSLSAPVTPAAGAAEHWAVAGGVATLVRWPTHR